jgi:SAM-dependent methyltransferase
LGLRDPFYEPPGHWNFWCCLPCGLAWLAPYPIADDLGRLYYEYYHYTHGITNNAAGRVHRLWKSVGLVLANAFGYHKLAVGGPWRTCAQVLSGIGPARYAGGARVWWLHARHRRNLLDVGCGNGQFLARMRGVGWPVGGVEPDPVAVRVARENLGLDIHHGLLAEISFPDARFDAIVLRDVIDYVPDPLARLAECRRVLKPGGQLVVVTPNGGSLACRLLDRAAALCWCPPRHAFVFSTATIRTCAARASLDVRIVSTIAMGAYRAWQPNRLLQRHASSPALLPSKPSLPLRVRRSLESLAFWTAVHLGGAVWHHGEEIVLVASKGGVR